MERLKPYFRISFRNSHMVAEVQCTEAFTQLEEKLDIEPDTWNAFLAANKVVYGIKRQGISQLVENPLEIEYPFTIAEGQAPVKGVDGEIRFELDMEQRMKKDQDWNFREVMKIPSVVKGQKLAELIHPTQGTDGKNVMGLTVKAIPGKPAILRPGKNVVFNEADNCYYATEDGQFSHTGSSIQVLPEFHVNETLTLKTGNLDFIGTIVIRGDVPTGFTVKAAGDVKIFGMVEAATVIAGGSIYITEGISGQGKGILQAGGNLQIGYINQANISVGNDLYVENSILHSECVVQGHVYSQRGNIIGGTLSAGKTIEAKDIGTRMNTRTEIVLGVNKSMADKEDELKQRKKELEEMHSKLMVLGEKLAAQSMENPKVRISLLRQRHSLEKVSQELKEINQELEKLNASIGDLSETQLVVRNFLYQNVVVTFGKYKRLINADYHYVQLNFYNNEISLQQLF